MNTLASLKMVGNFLYSLGYCQYKALPLVLNWPHLHKVKVQSLDADGKSCYLTLLSKKEKVIIEIDLSTYKLKTCPDSVWGHPNIPSELRVMIFLLGAPSLLLTSPIWIINYWLWSAAESISKMDRHSLILWMKLRSQLTDVQRSVVHLALMEK